MAVTEVADVIGSTRTEGQMSTYLDCVYPEPALDVLQDKLAAAYAAYIQHTIAAEVEVEDTDPYSDEAFEQEQNI